MEGADRPARERQRRDAEVGVREKLGVTMEPTVIGGVKAFILSPKVIPAVNQTACSFTCTAAATSTFRANPAPARPR